MNLDLIKQIRIFGSSLTVLYVEDDISVRDSVYRMLNQIFDDVDVAEDGEIGLEKYKIKKYDLVLTDLKMPNIDGILLSERIMAENKEQTIVVISAYKELDELFCLINIGVSGFILKPIDFDKMLQKLYIVVKDIYANKMMKFHYNEMKEKLVNNAVSDKEYQIKDALTCLYNYKHLMVCLNDNQYAQSGLLININDFKLINDYYSYTHGNHLLYQVAEILKSEVNNSNYDIFRVSSDEFVLLKKDAVVNYREIESYAKHIYKALESKRFNIIGVGDISIRVTIGIAKNSNRLLEDLQQALNYARKYAIKYAFYEDVPDDSKNVRNIMKTKQMLQSSIESDLVVPVYQPIVMRDKTIKYEVLMRIKNIHDNNKLVTPGSFLAIAKKHSYYNELSQMVIFKAIDFMLKNDHVFSFNFSYPDMNNNDLIDKLEKTILEHNIGERLIFEIVETDQLDNIDTVSSFIDKFRLHGVKFAIDDFGSGYSNFAYIFNLNPDYIKIDGSLIADILYDIKMYTFVKTIIEFAHKLNVEVIAEHVSSQELHDALVKLDVDAMQGFYIGHPAESIAC